jgi:hypothetical protein
MLTTLLTLLLKTSFYVLLLSTNFNDRVLFSIHKSQELFDVSFAECHILYNKLTFQQIEKNKERISRPSNRHCTKAAWNRIF